MKKLMWMAVVAMAFVSCQSGNKKNAEEVMENEPVVAEVIVHEAD